MKYLMDVSSVFPAFALLFQTCSSDFVLRPLQSLCFVTDREVTWSFRVQLIFGFINRGIDGRTDRTAEGEGRWTDVWGSSSVLLTHLGVTLHRPCYLKESCLLFTLKTYRSCSEPEWATGWMVWSSNPDRGKRFFSSPKRSHCLWGPPSLLFNGYPVLPPPPPGKSGRGQQNKFPPPWGAG